jgi:hypothetical protein
VNVQDSEMGIEIKILFGILLNRAIVMEIRNAGMIELSAIRTAT